MTIGSYLAGTAMEFSKSLPIFLITVIAEWICFLVFTRIQALKKMPKNCRRQVIMSILLLLMDLLLMSRFYPIAVHCMIQILLWSVYLWIVLRCRWYSAVFDSSIFLLLLEIGKALFRGGTLAYALWKHFPGLPMARISRITFLAYILYLALLSLGINHFSNRKTHLEFDAPQAAGLLFPVLVYLYIRQFQSGLDAQTPASLYFQLDLIGIAVAVCALIVVVITYNMLQTQNSRNELLHRQLLAEQQHSQYLIQKEAIDAVNRKYHDLKHYLTAMESSGSKTEMKQFAKDMEKEIRPVETIRHTGNETMDILLAARIAQCQEKEIRFIPYIDGKNLDKLSIVDLCTLFGNAMDNAVEASEKIEQKDHREISVKIENYGSMIIFRFVNCCETAMLPQKQEFRTTKSDPSSHGYGMDSIRSIAEKYGGSMSAVCENGIFELVVLIPVNNSDPK